MAPTKPIQPIVRGRRPAPFEEGFERYCSELGLTPRDFIAPAVGLDDVFEYGLECLFIDGAEL